MYLRRHFGAIELHAVHATNMTRIGANAVAATRAPRVKGATNVKKTAESPAGPYAALKIRDKGVMRECAVECR